MEITRESAVWMRQAGIIVTNFAREGNPLRIRAAAFADGVDCPAQDGAIPGTEGFMDEISALLGGLKFGVGDIVFLIVLSLPPVFILFSRQVTGRAKFWWFILTSIFSWLAYAAFLYAVAKKKRAAESGVPTK